MAGARPSIIDTGTAIHCNNDHGISPDQKWLAISDSRSPTTSPAIYIVPIGGGTPRRVTQNSPVLLARLVAGRQDAGVYRAAQRRLRHLHHSRAGGEETRLTTAKGLDDGPEYSPDGKYIYFNSERTGQMQIWRMLADGS